MQDNNEKAPNNELKIGALLAEARSQKGITLREVESVTKISYRVLESIEQDKFEDIGASVYVRGYLKIYAKYLGLDTAKVIEIYEASYPSEEVRIQSSSTYSHLGYKKKKRTPRVIAFILVALLLVGLYYLRLLIEPLLFSKLDEVSLSTSNETTLVQPIAIEVPSTDESKVSQEGDIAINELLTIADEAESQADNVLESTGSDNILAVDIPLNNIENLESESSSTPGDLEQDLPETVLSEEDINAEVEVTLSLAFTGDCWVQINDSTEKRLAGRLYKQGETLSVKGVLPLTLKIGDVTAVNNVLLNNESININNYKTGNISFKIDND